MADNKLLQQMLESLVNDDQAKAEELFHEYVVAKSREIYESMIDSEIVEETDEDEEEEVEEAAKDDDAEEDQVDENFEDIAIEADDEEDMMGGDATDDLEGELEMSPEEGEEEEKSEEELFQDLDSIVDELQAKFDELKGMEQDEHEADGETGEEEMEGFGDLETVREYVEKVPAGHGAEKKGAGEQAANTKSIVAGKNDMGGTAANIAKSGEEKGGDNAGLGQLKPQAQDGGNINVPGGKAGGAFSKKEPGHGAEKAGSKESADNKQSLFRGRR